ncbi:MAG: peptidylprolyl isomerase [Bacteriovoracaceae bacterium]|nr:peptidylprolyl isomerase [Bacteriovoracaceae bacterium]
MKNKLLLLITFLTLITTAHASKKDDIVATVNGSKITKSVFLQTYRQNMMFVGSTMVTRDKVINDLINRELGIQKAKKEKLSSNPLVKRKMEDILYHAQISKDLEHSLKKIKVSDDDVKQYYKSHPEYRTAHILLRLPIDPKVKEEKLALEQALKLYAMLKNSPDRFAELANKYAQTAAAKNGGDVGFQPAVNLAPEYFKAIRGKKPGYISPPVRTQFGFHIIKLMAIRNFKDIALQRYKKVVYDQKRDKILAKYFADMRSKAKIKIHRDKLK